MKKIVKCIDKFVENTLKLNINSTTSVAAYQPQVPTKLNSLSKLKNVNDK